MGEDEISGGDGDIGSFVNKAQDNAKKKGRRGGFFKGVFATTVAAVVLWTFAPQNWIMTDYVVHNYKNGIEVSRMYRPGPDKIQVKTPNTDFVPLRTYLNGIEDKADREVERAEILRLVDWYKQ